MAEIQEDRPPYIQFERRAVENKRESLKQGHYVADDVDFVMVTLPGGRDVFENKVDIWLERQASYARTGRINPEWLEKYKEAYKRWKKGEEMPEDGTPIKGWQALSPAQTQVVIRAGIRTVEDLARVNDEALRRLGMGGRDLVNKAKSWLDTASEVGRVAVENAELKKKNQQLETTVESLEEKVNLLMQKMEYNQTDKNVTGSELYEAPRETITAADIMPEYEPEPTEGPERIISRAELNRLYREKFNRKANVRMTDESIKQKLGI